jgi:GH24 family phage-related lysozyme (muramidase)
MGGKSGTTTQSVSIPPDVLKRYNAVNTRAENVAQKPFQPYTGQFVADITPTQQAGINATTQYAQSAQPYYQAATGQLGQAQGQGQQAIQQAFGSLGQGVDVGQQYAQAATQGIGAALQAGQPYQTAATNAAYSGAQALTPENINIQGYMSPYTQAVADTTFQALRQQQQQEMQGATANAIKSGAFGGDRAGLVAANLARQQQLGTAQAMAPIYQQGYGQALGSAMTAAQSNRAALQNLAGQLQGIGQQGYGQQMGAAQQMAGLGQQQFGQGLGAAGQLGALGQQQYGMGAGTAQQLAALGSGAQQSALQGAQAQLGAGTLEQQTQQADLTARYQQFLQERGYDFQVAQFLANIAMGTGALSGSTTTTTQPMPFFSDRRVKDDVKEIGKTHDGLPIYSYKYKGDDQTQIGLMAQDVEKKHPEAVYDMGGVKGVDYKQATEHAERPERYSGGLVPASQGGSVYEPGAYARGGYNIGGDVVDPNDLQAIIAQQQQAFGPFSEGGLYGGSQHETPFANAKGIVPQSRMHVPKLKEVGPAPRLPDSGAQQALSVFDTAVGMKNRYETGKEALKGLFGGETETESKPKNAPQTVKGGVVPPAADKQPKVVPSVSAKTEDEPGILDRIKDAISTNIYDVIGRADGGLVPRHAYAVGGMSKDPSLPYEEDDKSPYKYFPTEILESEKPELQKPSQSSSAASQTGIGAGDVIKLISMLPFSDRRVKHDVKEIGKTHDGQPIYSYKYNGDNQTRMGLMAQDVEKHNPDAVHTIGGVKAVDYKRATKGAERDERYSGGLVSRHGYQEGGVPEDYALGAAKEILRQREGFLEQPKFDVNALRGGYGTDQFTTPEGKVLPVTAETRFTKEDAERDLNRRALLFMQKAQSDIGPENWQRLTPDAKAALTSVTYNYGSVPKSVVAAAQTGDIRAVGDAVAGLAKHNEGINAGRRMFEARFINPEGDYRADLSASRATSASLGVKPSASEGTGLMPQVRNYLAENQSWLSPLGAGLRGMVQSRSPFLAGALLEGAGTGLEAVGAAQKQAADTALTRANEVAVLSRLPKDAVLIDDNGRPYGVRVYINGKMTTVPFGKFMEAMEQGKSFDLAPPPFATEKIEAPDLGVSPQPPQTGGAEPTQPAPISPQAGVETQPEQAAAPIYARGSTSPEVKDIALQAGNRVRQSGIKVLQTEPSANPFGAQEKIAADATRDTLQRNTLAASLGDLPRGGSLLASGPFGAEYGKPFVDYVNNVLRSVNAGFSIADPSDLANAETAQKISTLLASRRTSEAGQRANAAFETILQAVPSYYNSPEGQSQLLADLYQSQQREIDMHRFYQNVRQNAEKNIPGFTAVESQYMGQGLADTFAAQMEDQYAKEKQDLAKLYMIPLEVVDEKTGKVTNTYVLPYLAKMAGKISDEDKATIVQKYGVSPDIFRYFSAK